MALLFDANGESVNYGNAAGVNDIFKGTATAWFMLSALPATQGHPLRILTKGNEWIILSTQGINFFIAAIDRATLDQTVNADMANWAVGVVPNKPLFIAVTFDTGGADTDQKIYIGDLDTPAAEPSAYTTQRVGTGAVTSNAAKNMYAGNNPDVTTEHLGGWLGDLHLFPDVLLTRGQIVMHQAQTRLRVNRRLWTRFGEYGAGQQYDRSGNGHVGTVTGATYARVPAFDDLFHVKRPRVFPGGLTVMDPSVLQRDDANVRTPRTPDHAVGY